MKPLSHARILLVATLALASVSFSLASTPYILLGPSDNVAIDQPRVAVRVEGLSTPQAPVPDIGNTFLLDTGAQGLMAVGYAVNELDAAGYVTEAVYMEQGVAGYQPFDVSAEYDFSFAGTIGFAYTLTDARLLSDSSVNFGGFSGVVGMPAMVNRVTSLDMTAMLGGGLGIYMGVAFSATPPASNGHRYSVPMTLVDFPPSGQINPSDPLPTYAPAPFLDVDVRHSGWAAEGLFLLDTGAQMSMISTNTALSLGMDTNGNGELDGDEVLEWTAIGGVGGSLVVPIVAMDELRLPTNQGVDLVWTDLQVLVIDISVDEADPIAGIFGCELLTGGWLEPVFEMLLGGEGPFGDGFFQTVHFDFNDASNMAGEMLLDLAPDRDVVKLVGDLNGDDIVGLIDLNMILIDWGRTGEAISDPRTDVSGDGTVGIEDLNAVLIDWGQIAP